MNKKRITWLPSLWRKSYQLTLFNKWEDHAKNKQNQQKKKDVCAFAITEWQKYVENWCIITWYAGWQGGGLTAKIVYTLY